MAISRLKATTRKLEKINKLQEYDIIMQEQIQEGIVEELPPKTIGEVLHYVPHHRVICEEADSTKLRIVYDCSAKGNCELPSLIAWKLDLHFNFYCLTSCCATE